jgi:hypothetical protein
MGLRVSMSGNRGFPALGQSFPHVAHAASMARNASARTVPAVYVPLSFAETRGPSNSARHSSTNAKHFFGLRMRNSAFRISNATGTVWTPDCAPRRVRSVVQLRIGSQARNELRCCAADLAAGGA